MYGYRSPYPYQPQDQRFFGWGLLAWPLLGGLAGGFAGGLLGSALFYPRPYYGYPGVGVPPMGYPGMGYPYYY